ncbi:symmetrical bis(5'-nucleosyl)-tetraphosphatase [Vibrio diabolicus]|uniref:symmetrical bis(5'-nucleosyl)-tetraphosphatase n=1 Tax=Vibrio TaxID=662 RepID=UPI00094080EB|nr:MULTISPECIES: symmetrical bis(5'-nucleosyl)-tetraphosphatase [Vibrio]MCR9608352.1 symmetrical bis(5'-nucleosyl)-tetraphosphatase [Vibrio alginolyticus]AVF94132.1 symmetrical bis(5'-nucleosyl)-tetraphosphatase [Vibrio diabolicus]MCR9472372.1 symmetrical bis(5'-nucleosyl)-tetraphosphatase [Vibrio diabolicus]MCR9613830.1 symmetrical bis(5'-nucleosyl)-tetraphosphatase [Vibrio alginolyticus]MCS0327632.1 symmetrical bis(5'-nucleosyl)-tetraphosphatase [Vibrio diabolicus]
MATYIVGDIQGCFDELQRLLEQVSFSAKKDQLWLAGDLVARGPKSLETLRFVKSLGKSATVVLGNHDLHLLAVAHGIKKVKDKDKTAPIFTAPDKEDLLAWIAQQPLMAEHDEFVMCHAGISPQWNLKTARKCAREVERIIQSEELPWLLKNMYSNQPDSWHDSLQGLDRYRYIINAFTRMRFCFPDGRLDMDCKLPPQQVSGNELIPWFDVPQRVHLNKTVLFGHWAALQGHVDEEIIGLDTGCVWGGSLTMIRWDDKKIFTQDALS